MKYKDYLLLILFILIIPYYNQIIRINNNTTVQTIIYEKEEEQSKEEYKVLKTIKGHLTGYGPDCIGCSGYTASGFNCKKSIYYKDKEYGTVRVLSGDKSLKFGTIVRIRRTNKDDIIGIVLDRGGNVGFNKKSTFDLLVKNEKSANKIGYQKAKFDILRYGYK